MRNSSENVYVHVVVVASVAIIVITKLPEPPTTWEPVLD